MIEDISSGAVGTQTLTLGATGSTGGTLSGIIGGGTGIMNLAVAGAGTFTLSGQNTYTGGTTNSGAGGIVIPNNAAALGTGPFTFTGGRRLVVNTGLNITNAITIAAGGGESGRGMLESGPTAGTATLSGPITFTTTSGAGGHMLAPAGTILHISGVITSTVPVSSRSGTVMLSGGGTGYTNFNLQGGIVQVGAANGMSTAATVSVGGSATATLDLNGFNQSFVGITKGANPATITNSSSTTPAVFTLTGSTTTNFVGAIMDSGGAGKLGITVNGGSATLSGTNTYTGSTTISGSGSLALSQGGRITNSPVIDVQSGAQFIVTNVTGGFTLVANQTLKGNGLVDGQVNVAVGGILAPGASIGTLTMSTNPILGGTVQAEVNTANSPNADKLVISSGTLTYGGTLTVANLGAIPANGTVFDLFDAPAFAGGFSSVTLPSGGTLHWNTNGLTVDGSIAFTNTVPTATNILASRSSGLNFKIKRSLVLSNAADLDGDALTLTFASTTTNGAAITSDAEYIYIPTNNVADAFNYTVTDGFGGTNTAAVNIAIATGLNGQLATVTYSGNLATATFYGVIGYAYNVERSTNGMSTWQVISNYPAGGVMTLNDDVSGLDPIPASAFYRLSVP